MTENLVPTSAVTSTGTFTSRPSSAFLSPTLHPACVRHPKTQAQTPPAVKTAHCTHLVLIVLCLQGTLVHDTVNDTKGEGRVTGDLFCANETEQARSEAKDMNWVFDWCVTGTKMRRTEGSCQRRSSEER